MRVLAVIPARGGSKRIPRKNIKNFLGKPIIAYSITAALDSGVFDEVMVSTEDEEIAAIARQYGASVPFMRSPEAASDTAVDNDVMREVINEYKKLGKTFDYMAYIYPCAPFVTAENRSNCWTRMMLRLFLRYPSSARRPSVALCSAMESCNTCTRNI